MTLRSRQVAPRRPDAGYGTQYVDLGDEPALTLAAIGEAEQRPPQRAISWRWMTGTVLTGITSIVLMGTALTGALSTPGQYASLPESTVLAPRAAEFGEKGDRIREAEERISNRQVLKVSTVIRQGGQDFIKLRPFARINATLATRRGELAEEVPKYDPLRIFADTSEPEPPAEDIGPAVASDDELYGATADGEVAVRVTPFPIDHPDLEPSAEFSEIEVEHIVRLQASLQRTVSTAQALAFAAAPLLEDVDAFDLGAPAATSVSIIPENLSNIAKTDESNPGGLSEAVVSITDGGLGEVLATNEVSETDARQIMAALTPLANLDTLGDDDRIRIGYAPGREEGSTTTVRVSLYREGVHQATVARADSGVFVRADEPSSLIDIIVAGAPEPETEARGAPASLYDAVYEVALEQEIPKPLIDQLIRIFAFDVDFQARSNGGDAIEVFHSMPDENDEAVGEPEILFAALEHEGVMRRFYRFRTPDDGLVDYYDEEGKSAKKFLMRKPVADGRLRSRYGMRRHPVLGVRRLHAGVDYGAKRGTPIFAAGNGVVEDLSRSRGYGNLTVVRHTNGYETYYAHQTRFAKGLKEGSRVRQGQIIGYVGSTGLSTGPHLHYEIRVNGKTVDPLRIRLPQGRVLQDDILTTFQRERERIDRLLGNETPTQVASNE